MTDDERVARNCLRVREFIDAWGKVDPEKLPDSVTCYGDSTLALPLLTAYALARHEPRPHKRLMDKYAELTGTLEQRYRETRQRRGE